MDSSERGNREKAEPNPSMSNDNTSGSAANQLIDQVREGMRVLDATGEEVGTVEYVSMGDPAAVTVGADAPPEGGFLQGLAEAFGAGTEPAVPEPLRSRLLRAGFIKIDGKGWIDTDRYVMASMITSVASDTVRLNANRNEMPSDSM